MDTETCLNCRYLEKLLKTKVIPIPRGPDSKYSCMKTEDGKRPGVSDSKYCCYHTMTSDLVYKEHYLDYLSYLANRDQTKRCDYFRKKEEDE